MAIDLEFIIETISNANIDGKAKQFLKDKGEESARLVVKHIFAEHTPIDTSGDISTLQKKWSQAAFENFKHFLRVGGHDYGMPEFHGIQVGADLVYMDGGARTAIHDLCNAAVEKELEELMN